MVNISLVCVQLLKCELLEGVNASVVQRKSVGLASLTPFLNLGDPHGSHTDS